MDVRHGEFDACCIVGTDPDVLMAREGVCSSNRTMPPPDQQIAATTSASLINRTGVDHKRSDQKVEYES